MYTLPTLCVQNFSIYLYNEYPSLLMANYLLNNYHSK